MLELIPEKLAGAIVIIFAFFLLPVLYGVFKEAIKDQKELVVSKPENKIVRS